MDETTARSPRRRLLLGVRRAIGLGMLAGTVDTVGALASAAAPMSVGDGLTTAAVAVAVQAAFGGLLGLVLGPIHTGRPPEDRAAPSVHLAAVAAALTAVVVAPRVVALDAEARTLSALAIALLVPLAAVAAFAWTRWLLGRAARGLAPPVGWLTAAAAASAVVSLAVSVVAARGPVAAGLADDPDVLIVTIDGLRLDDAASLGALAGRTGAVRFAEAVAPGGGWVAGNASVLTGLHPLRHRATRDGLRIRLGAPTLAERLGDAGWRTAAFVSSVAVAADTGLAAGFDVYDDGLGGPPGLGRAGLAGWLFADRLPLRRSGPETIEAALRWRPEHGPWLVWVHLADGLPGDADRGDQLRAMDAALTRLLAAFDGAVVIVAGSGGLNRGEHGRGPLSDEPWEARARVPLWLWAPGVPAAEVVHPVRLLDVAPTVLGLVKVAGELGEGVDLGPWLTPPGGQALAATLIGHDPDGRVQLGLRASGAKVLIDLASGGERLYDLARDPGETKDVYAEQAFVMDVARRVLSSEVAAARALGDGVSVSPALGARIERLRAKVGR
jgi:hypothetical protein